MIRTPGSHASDDAMYGLEEAPDDRRLHSYWKPGWLSGVKRGARTIDVELGAAPTTRPPGMDAATAEASVQQLVYTVQSALGSHDPVRFLRDRRSVATVLGVATSRPVAAAPFEQVMSLVSVQEPESDEEVAGRHPYTAGGTALTADHRVTVRLEQGGGVLETRTVTLGHRMRDGEYPWQATFPIKGLKPGLYLVVASGQDPRDPSRTQTDQAVLHLD
jgi:hypothetical protein